MGHFKKEKDGRWSVQFYYEDCTGKKKRKHKLGFKTKKEADEWMHEFIKREQSDMDMCFDTFVALYLKDISKDLRKSTMKNKRGIIEMHLLPYFKDSQVRDISPLDVKRWQNEMKDKDFSSTYLRTLNAQLSAIFNHAVKFYHLSSNPCVVAGGMGKSKRRSEDIAVWTVEEMDQFLDTFEEKDRAYYAFFLLYWTGIRLGEMLALTLGDIDFDQKKLSITKSYQKIDGEELVTKPKTDKSNRIIELPDFVVEELREYTDKLYGVTKKDRLFQISKGGLEKIIKRNAEKAGLKKIRVHDLRHSHASLLIANHIDIATISRRLGHENIKTTLDTYSHMFDKNARATADILDTIRKRSDD